MNISIGLFINSSLDFEKAFVLSNKGINCHLSFMHYKDFVSFKEYIPKNLKITSLHGFNSDRNDSFSEYIKKLEEFKDYFKSFKDNSDDFMITVHPNQFGEEFVDIKWTYPEVFPYSKKKMLRTPLDILKKCGRMTLDTSHLDQEWYASENIIRSLINNSDIVHLSQRTSKNSESHHKPISVRGEVPMDFILRALNQKPVKEVVLEYMPEYFEIAIKDYSSLKNIVTNLKK